MILALGASGRGFDSHKSPITFAFRVNTFSFLFMKIVCSYIIALHAFLLLITIVPQIINRS